MEGEEEDFLTCNFCNQKYNLTDRKPKILTNCGHSICEYCLLEYLDIKIKIRCYLDNVTTKTENKNISDFEDNDVIIDLLIRNNDEKEILCNFENLAKDKDKTKVIKKSLNKRKSEKKNDEELNNGSNDVEICSFEFENLEKINKIEFLKEKKKIIKNTNKKSSSKMINKNEIDENKIFCEIHEKKKELICVKCSIRICYHCGLFGVHIKHAECVKTDKIFTKEVEDYQKDVKKIIKKIGKEENYLKSKFIKSFYKKEISKKMDFINFEIDDIFGKMYEKLKKQKKDILEAANKALENTEKNIENQIIEDLEKIDENLSSKIKRELINLVNQIKKGETDETYLFKIMKEKKKVEIIKRSKKVSKTIRSKIHKLQDKIENYLKNFKIIKNKNCDLFKICELRILDFNNTNILENLSFSKSEKSEKFKNNNDLKNFPSSRQKNNNNGLRKSFLCNSKKNRILKKSDSFIKNHNRKISTEIDLEKSLILKNQKNRSFIINLVNKDKSVDNNNEENLFEENLIIDDYHFTNKNICLETDSYYSEKKTKNNYSTNNLFKNKPRKSTFNSEFNKKKKKSKLKLMHLSLEKNILNPSKNRKMSFFDDKMNYTKLENDRVNTFNQTLKNPMKFSAVKKKKISGDTIVVEKKKKRKKARRRNTINVGI